MKSNDSGRRLQRSTRFKWVSVTVIFMLVSLVMSPALLWPRGAEAAVTLNPMDPSNFTEDGGQTITPGSVLTFTDQSVGDIALLFSNDADALPGVEVDIVATFQILSTSPNNVDVGNRVAIIDANKAAIAACVILNGVKGIGLMSTGPMSDPASYPVFVAVDWQVAPVTIRLRRYANGDAELVEVNGVAPSPRALLTVDKLAVATRPLASVELGAASPEARCTVAYSAFRSERVVQPVSGTLNFTRFRLRDTDSPDRVRFRGDYKLGTTSNGIDPTTEPVTIKLSTPAGGQFYPSPNFNPVAGFIVQGSAGKRRWTLNDSERARTDIESLVFDEGSNNTGSIALRDFRTGLFVADFSLVNVEITIGAGATADKLTGSVNLVEKPAGSGQWRMLSEP